jgi:hypothetical protein
MSVRAEMNMKIAGRDLSVDFNEDKRIFELTVDKNPLLTPSGNPVVHDDVRFLYHIMAELRCLKTLDSKLNLLWLYCSAADHGQKLLTAFSEKEVRAMLLSDPILARSAAPDCASAQMEDWMALGTYLSQHGLQYPDLPQGGDPEEYLKECGEEAVENFERLVKKLTNDIAPLSVAQKTVIANATNCYGSFTWAFFLATKQVTPLEFATGIAAAQSALPWAFGDVKLKEYAEAIRAISYDAMMMQWFVEAF